MSRAPAPVCPLSRLPDAMKPGIHGAGTHWIWGFIAFQAVRRIRTVMLMVPVCLESGSWDALPEDGERVAHFIWNG